MSQSIAKAQMQGAFNLGIQGVAGPAMSYGFSSGAFSELRFDTLGQQDEDMCESACNNDPPFGIIGVQN